MRLAGLLPESLVDGPGIRFVIFAQGCPHACPECHNRETWDPLGGREMSVKEIMRTLKKTIKQRHLKGITLSGGEPFIQAQEMTSLAREARKLGLDIVTYTGFVYEDLLQLNLPGVEQLLEVSDLLIDGPYIRAMKDIGLSYRGSSNQRMIDLAATRVQGRLIILS